MIVTVAALGTELLFAPRPALRVGVGREAGGRLGAWLDEHEPEGAIVIGFSGATRAGVRVRQVILAAEILWDGASPLRLDRALLARAEAALSGVTTGAVATLQGPASPPVKARRGVDALAVDMESAYLARELAWRGIPFLVVRIILDELWEDIPRLPIRWAGRALSCSRALGKAAARLRPVLV